MPIVHPAGWMVQILWAFAIRVKPASSTAVTDCVYSSVDRLTEVGGMRSMTYLKLHVRGSLLMAAEEKTAEVANDISKFLNRACKL